MCCKNCGMEFDGNFCPNCGAPKDLNCEVYSVRDNEDGNMNYNDISAKKHKLLGFRSNKLWKKVVSVIYMIIVGLFVIGSTSEINSINDAILSIQGTLTLISPYVFLSDFKLRTFLPLFKENKKSKSFLGLVCVNIVICLFCYMINPATHCEHKWVEKERKTATCNEEGYINSHCDLCDSDNTEYIDKIEHAYEPVKGKDIVICSGCGDKLEEITTNKEDATTEKTTHKHSWDKATCEQPSICKDCGTTKGDALGHSTDCGICTRCNKEFRKQSPITILNWTYTVDYVGGVEWNFNIKNNTDKQIKYVTLKWDCYNAVGDLIYDEISWKSYVKVRFTGPLNAHSTSERNRNTTKFYNHNLKTYKLTEATIEYMDGTIETLNQYYDGVLE